MRKQPVIFFMLTVNKSVVKEQTIAFVLPLY